MSQRILFVGAATLDDYVRRRLEQKGFSVLVASDLERASDLLTGSRVDVLIVDFDQMDDGSGFIKRVRSLPALRGTSILAIAKWGTGQPMTALSAGADAYEPAPIDAERLADTVDRILNKRAAVAGVSE